MKKNIIQEVFKFTADKPSSAENNYILSNANHQAFLYIRSWPNWQNSTTIIHGSAGTGKTHLSKLWQKSSRAINLDLFNLTQEKLNELLEKSNCFIIEDFEQYFSQKHKLRNLDTHDFVNFAQTINEIINDCALNKGYLLLTTNQDPDNVNYKLKDLESRIKSCPRFVLGAPDEAMISTFLVKKFSELQLKVGMEVIKYISSRIERSLTKANKFAEQLDNLSLTSKKQPSIHMSRMLLSEYNNKIHE